MHDEARDPYEFDDGEMEAYVREQEALAEAQAIAEAEQAEVDAAMSEAAAAFAKLQTKDHAAEEAELGFALAWWEKDEDDTSPFDTVSFLTNEVCAHSQYVRKMAEYGLPLNAGESQVTLNHLTGPIVVGALQILGVIHPHLRDEVRDILKVLNEAAPGEPTEEEQALYEQAQTSIREASLREMAAAFREGGVPVEVMSVEDAQALVHEQEQAQAEQKRQAGLN